MSTQRSHTPERTGEDWPRTIGFGSRIRLRADPRAALVTVLLLAAAFGAILTTLATGALPVPPDQVFAALLGRGDPFTDFALFELGFPRVAAALTVGAALGAAGMLIQSLTSNPLGSPDVIGFNAGAATGAVVGLLVLRLDVAGASLCALVAGLLTAALVIGASNATDGIDSGYRLILVGIGVGAALLGLNSYLITRARVEDTKSTTRWLAGSLSDATWGGVAVVAIALVVLLPACAWLADRLRIAGLGPQVAVALGVRLRPMTIGVLVVAVALCSAAVVAAGPIGFVALAAPQLAGKLTGTPAGGVASSAAMGALLLAVSDLVAQRAFADADLPVGVVTGVVGGAYLVWVLAREWRTSP